MKRPRERRVAGCLQPCCKRATLGPASPPPLVGEVELVLGTLYGRHEGVQALGGPLEHLLTQRMEPPGGAGPVRVREPHKGDLSREVRPRELPTDLSDDPVMKLLTRELRMCHRHPPRANDPSAKLRTRPKRRSRTDRGHAGFAPERRIT